MVFSIHSRFAEFDSLGCKGASAPHISLAVFKAISQFDVYVCVWGVLVTGLSSKYW